MMRIRLCFCVFVGLISSCVFSQKKIKSKPDFVVIFTDDQGYGDLSCFGGEHVYTPNIDKMAEEGAESPHEYFFIPIGEPWKRLGGKIGN